jgi:hypothetical protein
MKRLISIIIVLILGTSLTGCVVVKEHHHERVRRVVVAPNPRPVPLPPPPVPRRDGHHPTEGRPHPGPRYMFPDERH